MKTMKVVKITIDQFDQISKLGTEHEPFYIKLDRLTNQQIKKIIPKPKRHISDGPTPTTLIGQAFKEAYFKKFKQPYPTWGAKENSMISNWLKSVPFDHAIELVNVYPQWGNQFVIKSGHPLHLLIKLHHEMWTDRTRFLEKTHSKIKAKDQEEHIKSHVKLHERFDQDKSKQVPGHLQNEQSFIPFKND